jgi:hypothetical protein
VASVTERKLNDDPKSTNPKELIAAAHAGCFTMALAFGLQLAGFTPEELAKWTILSLNGSNRPSTADARSNLPMMDGSESFSFSIGWKAACARRVHREIKKNPSKPASAVDPEVDYCPEKR